MPTAHKPNPPNYRESQRELRRSPIRLYYALGIALLLHVAATPVLYEMFKPLPPPKKVTKVRMVPMPGNGQIARPTVQPRNEALERERMEQQKVAEEKKKEEERKKIEETLKDKQIVDVPPSPDDKVPENAKYLSEHNTNTQKETVSRNQQKDYQTAMNEPTVVRKSDGMSSPQTGGDPNVLEISPTPAKEDKKEQKKADTRKAQAPQLEFPKVAASDKVALALDPKMGTLLNRDQADEVAGNSDKLRISPGQDGANEQAQQAGRSPKTGKPAADLVPTIGTLSRIAGAPANDYLNEQEGDGTFLNTREFKYAGFFNRVKKGVSQRWNPIAEYQRRDPTGQVYGQMSRTTTLTVTLAPDGTLRDAIVSRSSGLPFLDEEAVQAFRRAQPFPNPPPQLVDRGGGITFQFGFVLEFRDGGLRLPF